MTAGYEGQKDVKSCGFYVQLTVCNCAASLGSIYSSSNNSYDSCVTKCYRQLCVRAYKEHVRDVYDLKESTPQNAGDRRPSWMRVSGTKAIIYIFTERMLSFTAQAHA